MESRLTRLPAGLSVTGDVHAHEDINIDGRLEGQLNAPDHHLDVREGAVVMAKIVVGTITISGTVDGTVAAARILIQPTANVRGHLVTPALTLREGARFTGTVDPAKTEAAMHVAKYRQKHTEAAKAV